MKTRSKIELGIVISVILAKCFALQQQFSADGAISVILFGVIALAATAALLRRTPGLAFTLAIGSTFSAFALAREYVFMQSHSLASILLFTRDEVVYLGFAACLFHLWAEWRVAEAKLSSVKA